MGGWMERSNRRIDGSSRQIEESHCSPTCRWLPVLAVGLTGAKPRTDPLSKTSSEQSIQCGHGSFFQANLLGPLNHV